jgi:hypothetical protein
MADPRRWDASSRRDDQFVRPPAFRDEHESSHLAAGQAHWHGSGSRQVALAVGLAVAAGIAAVAFMLLVSPGGGDLASQGGPVAADADDDPIDVGDIQVPASAADGNSTTGLPIPDLPVP